MTSKAPLFESKVYEKDASCARIYEAAEELKRAQKARKDVQQHMEKAKKRLEDEKFLIAQARARVEAAKEAAEEAAEEVAEKKEALKNAQKELQLLLGTRKAFIEKYEDALSQREEQLAGYIKQEDQERLALVEAIRRSRADKEATLEWLNHLEKTLATAEDLLNE